MVVTYPMPYGKRSEEPPDRDAGKETSLYWQLPAIGGIG